MCFILHWIHTFSHPLPAAADRRATLAWHFGRNDTNWILLAVTKPVSVSPFHCNKIYRTNPNGTAVLGPQRVSCTFLCCLLLTRRVKSFGEVNKAGEWGEMLHYPSHFGRCHTSQQAWVTSQQRGFCAMQSRYSLTLLTLPSWKVKWFPLPQKK